MSIVAQNLSKAFGKKNALDALTFELPSDSIVGLIGRNGAGKTTLLRVMAGYLRPSAGSVKIFGEEPFDNLKALSQILYMDDERYIDTAVLRDVVELAALSYQGFDKKMALKLMDYFGLSPKTKYKKLSKGTKTIFSLVIAIMSRSPLTMLDEPTLGLDAAHRKEFTSLLLKDYSEHPRTFFISSHLISELEGMMDQVLLIDKGQLVFHKTIEEVQSHALYLTGHRQVLEPLTVSHQVIYRDAMGEKLTLGVINTFNEEALLELAKAGAEITPMSVQDVCVNLTAATTGGVLDVIGE